MEVIFVYVLIYENVTKLCGLKCAEHLETISPYGLLYRSLANDENLKWKEWMFILLHYEFIEREKKFSVEKSSLLGFVVAGNR